MVVERTKDRYAILGDDIDPELAAKYEVLNSAEQRHRHPARPQQARLAAERAGTGLSGGTGR